MGYCLSNLRHLNTECYSAVFILWKSICFFLPPPPLSILLLREADAGHIPLICTAMRDGIGAILTLWHFVKSLQVTWAPHV